MTTPLDADHLIVVVESLVPTHAELLPHLVKWPTSRAEEPVHAGVEGVSLAFPGGAEAARDTVNFKDGRFGAVHASIASG
jgi:hypothetical protein